MAVEMIKKELDVPRNVQEIADLIVGLVEDIKAKKDLQLMLGENLPALMKAIEGMDKLGEEVKAPEVYAAVALMGANLAKVLLAKPPVVPAPAA